MKLFPCNTYTFLLNTSATETVERLRKRTKDSESLFSSRTDKTFIGKIKGKNFRVISSAIGKGAFCVLEGYINEGEWELNVTVHKAFKTLTSILVFMSLIPLFVFVATNEGGDVLPIIFSSIFQVLIIRFVFIQLLYYRVAKDSIRRLRDVLDLKAIEKIN